VRIGIIWLEAENLKIRRIKKKYDEDVAYV
jgi:hypothetical protein